MSIILRKTPPWWYRQNVAHRLVAGLLRPASALYGQVAKWNYLHRAPYCSGLPVVCVGNFTAGGAGKTPTVITLIHILQEMGEKPVVLTRGYGGKVSGLHQVRLEDKARDVGDEPLLLAAYTPVVISADRAAGARAIEQGEGTVIIMDDGFQNNSLAKDLSLVVVDGAAGIGNGLVMPSGPLRASTEFQMGLADALVMNGDGVGGKAVAELARRQTVPTLQASLEVDKEQAEWLRGKKVIAFTGIGRPDKFYQTLKDCGATVLDSVDFSDHHNFTHDEAAKLLEKASQTDGTYLVTTQKDAVRLVGGKGALQWLRYEAEVVGVTLKFGEADTLKKMLSDMLRKKCPS